MIKRVYMGRLFSKRREELVDKCIELHRLGKRFLYIMPSSAAIFQVRKNFIAANKGFLGSRVIVFDDLEISITKEKIPGERIIYQPVDRVIVNGICTRIKDSLKYYGGIYNKDGFHQEITAFIRTLKRSCIDEDGLAVVLNKASDPILQDKLHDLHMIYSEYNGILKSNDIYDRNDISLKAVDLVEEYRELDKIDTVVIDGFTDIEPVSMRLIKKIAGLNKVNIYVNCPYKNKLTEEFIDSEIRVPFSNMGFEILEDDYENIENTGFNEFCEKFYSGENISTPVENLRIQKYPNIESEVRETARSVKEKLMAGEKPEEIAVYVNNREDYSEAMHEIFREFGIPLSMTYELPLGISELVRKLIKSLENVSETSLTAGEWINLLSMEIENKKGYIEEIIKKLSKDGLDFIDRVEINAFDSLRKLLDETRMSFEMSLLLTVEMPRSYFIDYMLEGISSVSIVMEQGNNSGIRVMDTALSKGVYYNHVYILGVNEGEIPAVVKSAGLFDKFETEALNQNGIRYNDYLWELSREKIRFNLSMASAVKTLIISYRSADEEGKFAIPSLFIDEISFLVGLKEHSNYTMRDRFERKPDASMSREELEESIIKNYFENKYRNGECENLPPKYAEDIKEIINTGNVEYHRERKGEFNEYEGTLGEDFSDIAERIASFSPSALNLYLDCPFKYLVNVLYNPGEEPEDEFQYSNMETGDFYHRVLQSYYRKTRQFAALDEELLEVIIEELWSGMRKLNIPEDEVNGIREEYKGTLGNFITLDLERFDLFEKQSGGKLLRPYFLENAAEDEDIFGVRMKCKIDRVDMEYRMDGEKAIPTGRYVVYDYKKKSIPGINDVLNNSDYQLPVYYYMVEKELGKTFKSGGLECMALLYLSIEGSEDKIELDGIYKSEYKKLLGIKKLSDISGENFNALMEYIKGLIIETINKIKSGKFNYKPMCSHFEGYSLYPCAYERLCRYSKNKVRVIGEVGSIE